MRLRERPCRAFTWRASSPRSTWTWLSFNDAVIRFGSVQLSFPFGPSTLTAPSPVTENFTFGGRSMVLLPILDMALPDVGEQLAADVLFPGLTAREQAFRGG